MRTYGCARPSPGRFPGLTKLVYDFSEGSRELRDLLGGKGANVAEMTRVLGEDRVPAGFTITTEACVAYMKAGQEEPEGMADQVEEALAAHVRDAGLRREGEAGRHPLGAEHARHLGDVRALAAEERAHLA